MILFVTRCRVYVNTGLYETSGDSQRLSHENCKFYLGTIATLLANSVLLPKSPELRVLET